MAPPTALIECPIDHKHLLNSSPILRTLPPATAFNILSSPPPNNFPIIDLNDPSAPRAIASACHNGGYFLVVNHGIDPSTISALLRAVHQFFSLPLDGKMKYASDDPTSPVRYGSAFASTTTDLFLRDYLRHVGSPTTSHLWPTSPSTYAPLTADLLEASRALAVRLTSAIREEAGFAHDIDNHEMLQAVACNYYPPCTQTELALGVGAHKDPAAITFVVDNGVDGLQVRSKGGVWVAVPRVDGAVTVMMGESIEAASRGRVKAAEHRVVVNEEEARISVAIGNEPVGLVGSETAAARQTSLLAT